MALTVVSIAEIEPGDWDSLVRSSPDGWVFGLRGWQQLVIEIEPWGFQELGFGLVDGNELVAVMPLHFQPSSRVAASSGWGGAGPIVADGIAPARRASIIAEALGEAIKRSTASGAVRLDIASSPVTRRAISGDGDDGPYAASGFVDRSLRSQVIALDRSEQDIWMGLSKTARNLVRRAEKAGYRVEQVDWEVNLDAYYDMHTETYLRTGVTPHPKSYFAGIAKHIAASGSARLFAIVTPAGEPVAFHNMAVLGPGAFYHTGCSREIAGSDGAGYLLMFGAINAARSSGVTRYDCGWIFPEAGEGKQKGLTLFKTRFGGEPRQSFRAELSFAQQSSAVQHDSVPPSPIRRLGSWVTRLRRRAGS
ncbi:lipid II:glycine glycyltransferase FemX [Bradyrhizobium sp. AUGA SZCCT0431]|uniref:lipid II:glycine glycyltransferase FemX n=1 Tax=Bradyrhizobium sp. AUGA SZCCT0431 TaxID=2807674 RepID=UPI001BADB648|nr:GNAT family N-acetyltransferase [Bradyrhizobium sp. AUGA SZCCT0431]MBR1142370.1 GNAT family N-acetyltransferase [Bradyrhizobium sp. AUGA SZCCT0431]